MRRARRDDDHPVVDGAGQLRQVLLLVRAARHCEALRERHLRRELGPENVEILGGDIEIDRAGQNDFSLADRRQLRR